MTDSKNLGSITERSQQLMARLKASDEARKLLDNEEKRIRLSEEATFAIGEKGLPFPCDLSTLLTGVYHCLFIHRSNLLDKILVADLVSLDRQTCLSYVEAIEYIKSFVVPTTMSEEAGKEINRYFDYLIDKFCHIISPAFEALQDSLTEAVDLLAKVESDQERRKTESELLSKEAERLDAEIKKLL